MRKGTSRWPPPVQSMPALKASHCYRTIPIRSILPRLSPTSCQLPTHVRLEVFNVLGQHIATLVDREQPAGWHTATWHGTDAAGRAVAAGLYLYRIRGTGPSETRRMVLVDGPVSAPGAAFATEPPTSLVAPEPTYGLTVSGRDVVTYIDPGFPSRRRTSGNHRRSTSHQPNRDEGDHQ